MRVARVGGEEQDRTVATWSPSNGNYDAELVSATSAIGHRATGTSSNQTIRYLVRDDSDAGSTERPAGSP